jgi:hypothetical protein
VKALAGLGGLLAGVRAAAAVKLVELGAAQEEVARDLAGLRRIEERPYVPRGGELAA